MHACTNRCAPMRLRMPHQGLGGSRLCTTRTSPHITTSTSGPLPDQDEPTPSLHRRPTAPIPHSWTWHHLHHEAALVIQSVFRGHIARKWYQEEWQRRELAETLEEQQRQKLLLGIAEQSPVLRAPHSPVFGIQSCKHPQNSGKAGLRVTWLDEKTEKVCQRPKGFQDGGCLSSV